MFDSTNQSTSYGGCRKRRQNIIWLRHEMETFTNHLPIVRGIHQWRDSADNRWVSSQTARNAELWCCLRWQQIATVEKQPFAHDFRRQGARSRDVNVSSILKLAITITALQDAPNTTPNRTRPFTGRGQPQIDVRH